MSIIPKWIPRSPCVTEVSVGLGALVSSKISSTNFESHIGSIGFREPTTHT